MPKFKVSISYTVPVEEDYEIEFNDDETEALEEFRESPYDFCHEHDLVYKGEGDILEGSFHVEVEEVPVLDRIVEALNDA
jgi:hypothetical protein